MQGNGKSRIQYFIFKMLSRHFLSNFQLQEACISIGIRTTMDGSDYKAEDFQAYTSSFRTLELNARGAG